MMNYGNVCLVVVLVAVVALAGCPDSNNQNSDNPLVGLWEAVVTGGEDYGYDATWQLHGEPCFTMFAITGGFLADQAPA